MIWDNDHEKEARRNAYRGGTTLNILGAERQFRLRMEHIFEVEDVCGYFGDDGKRPKPIGQIWKDLADGSFSGKDVTEVIRHALIGGGAQPGEARGVVDRICSDDGMGLLEAAKVAQAIIGVAMMGAQVLEEDSPRFEKKKRNRSRNRRRSRRSQN